MQKKDLPQETVRRLGNGFQRDWVDHDPHRIGARWVTRRRGEPHCRWLAGLQRCRIADRDEPCGGDGASRGDNLARRSRRAPCSLVTRKGPPELVLENQDAAGQAEQHKGHAEHETGPQVKLGDQAPGHVSAQWRSRLW